MKRLDQIRRDQMEADLSAVTIQGDGLDADYVRALEKVAEDATALLGAVEGVLALHKPVYVYEYDDMNGVFKVDDAGEQIEMETLCSECTGASVLESIGDCEYDAGDYHDETPWPCPTVAAITKALEGDQP